MVKMSPNPTSDNTFTLLFKVISILVEGCLEVQKIQSLCKQMFIAVYMIKFQFFQDYITQNIFFLKANLYYSLRKFISGLRLVQVQKISD